MESRVLLISSVLIICCICSSCEAKSKDIEEVNAALEIQKNVIESINKLNELEKDMKSFKDSMTELDKNKTEKRESRADKQAREFVDSLLNHKADSLNIAREELMSR